MEGRVSKMKLSPAERRRIYEEEKTRLESEEKAEAAKEPGSSTNLKPNVAGLLCYLGVWVTGIIFLIIERKNKSLRFHAMQSLVTFGILHIIIAIADTVRDWATWWTGNTWGWLFNPQVVAANVIFGVFIAISIVLWIVLMYQTYHGRLVRLPLFGDLARKLLAKLDGIKEEDIEQHAEYAETEPEPPPSPVAKEPAATKDGMESYHEGTRHGRIASSAAAIAWSAIFLVFFNYFSKYFAIYSREAIDDITRWNIYPILTQDLNLVLPILNVTLILSIVGHSIIIALDRLDRYLLRQITLIVLNILGMITVLTVLRVFPFDFSVVPNTELAATLPTVAVVVMILITVGLGIGALVIFIKLIKRVAGCKKVKEV
jgi:uncharacterized membrane protein